jgi:serine/threonine-protein kinase RsbW
MSPALTTADPLNLELPTVPESVPRARHAIGEIAGVDRRAMDVATAVTEAVGNAVQHAYRDGPGTIAVRAEATDDQLTVVVADRGCGLTPHLESRGLGLGMTLVASVADRLQIETDATGTTLRMGFEL